MTWRQIGGIVVGLLQWTVAIVSVAGTLALFGWIIRMVIKKDKPL